MEDVKIKDLFSNYQPELSSSCDFMAKLQRNMEAVEIVKRHNAALKKRNVLAVAIAALSGFAMGVILTLLFPLIGNWTSVFHIPLPSLQISGLTIIGWIVVAAVSVLTALNAYEIAMEGLTSRDS